MQPANLFAIAAPTSAPGQAQSAGVGAGLGAAGAMGGLFGPVEGQEGADASGFAEALMAALMAGQPQNPPVNVAAAPQGDASAEEAKPASGVCASFGGMPVVAPVLDPEAPAADAVTAQVLPLDLEIPDAGPTAVVAAPALEADEVAPPSIGADRKSDVELPQAAAALKDAVRVTGRDVTSPAAPVAAATIPAPLQVALLEAGPLTTETPAPAPTDAEAPPPVAVQQAIVSAEAQKPAAPMRQESSKHAARDRADSALGAPAVDNAPVADLALATRAGAGAKDISAVEAFAATDDAGEDAVTVADTAEPAASPLPAPTARAPEAAPAFAEGAKVNGQTVAHLSAQIAKAAENGRSTRFDVQLEPYGLGKVDVRVEINKAGDIIADLRFDNPMAAADLKHRSGELAAALENAGFDPAKTQLSFSSSGQQNFAGQFGQDLWNQQQGQSRQGFSGRAFTDLADLADSPAAPSAHLGRTGGVDVRI